MASPWVTAHGVATGQCAPVPRRTGSAIGYREANGDHLLGRRVPAVVGARPGVARVPLRAAGALCVPVAGEVLALEAGLLSGLPAAVAAGRAAPLHAEARLRGH